MSGTRVHDVKQRINKQFKKKRKERKRKERSFGCKEMIKERLVYKT
jgi:ribosomal protein L34E